MALATARVTKPAKRKGRAAGTARPLLNISNNGNSEDRTAYLRTQYLAAIGMSELRARLVAGLAWECGA